MTLADKAKIVNSWFKKSRQDLLTAELLIVQTSDDFLMPAGFHLQQSAEKAIKGFLAFHKVRFPKTHNLQILTELVRQVDPNLATFLLPIVDLSQYAVAYRYPEALESAVPINHKSLETASKSVVAALNRLSTKCQVD